MKTNYVLIGSVLLLARFGVDFRLYARQCSFHGSASRFGCRTASFHQHDRSAGNDWRPADAAWNPASYRRRYRRNRKDVTEWATTRLASMSATARFRQS